jgi:arylsulfatase A-like enzyme
MYIEKNSGSMPERPNILVILTDQQSNLAMSCAGNEYIETPAMDRLAENGVRFENAYCTFPVCIPSRASLLSGRMPHEIEVMGNTSSIDAEFDSTSLGVQLTDAGYNCAYAGKWHLPERSVPVDNTYGFERIGEFNDLRLADNCREFFARDDHEPFCLVASFNNPHDICEWARDQHLPWGGVPVPSPEECPPLPPNVAPPPYEPECVDLLKDGTPFFNGAMRNASDDEWREYRHAYYRLVERVDGYVDDILSGLQENDLADDTVVLFTSDHGDGHGAHRCNQKTLLYEEMVNVPFVVSDPTSGPAGEVAQHLVSNGLDVLPTILDYADVEPEEELPGRSVRPVTQGEPVEWRDFLVTQTEFSIPHGDGSYDVEGRMVRSDRYKYVVYSRGRRREQLFDLESDPGEMVDLTRSATHEDVLQSHRERLLDWCLDNDDLFDEHGQRSGIPSIPGYELSEIYEYVDADPASRATEIG